MTDKLAFVAATEFFRLRRKGDQPALVARLRELFGEIVAAATKSERDHVYALLGDGRKLRAPPAELVEWLRDRGGRWVLVNWAIARGAPPGRAAAIVDRMIADAADPRQLLEAAIRVRAAHSRPGDETLIQQSFDDAGKKESVMGNQKVTFIFDPRGLPPGFDGIAFLARVNELLANTFGLPQLGNENTYGAIVGILLLNEQFDQGAGTFRDAVGEAWNETLVDVLNDPALPDPPAPGQAQRRVVSSRVAYEIIARNLKAFNLVPADPNGDPLISYQQFASVARFVISKADDVWLQHPNLPAQIRIGLDQYVAGPPLFETLDLPDLGDDAQIVADNVRSVGILAACYHLERTRLIDVLDAITIDFNVGKVPIGFDAAGRALDAYRSIPREQLLSPNERHAVYSRVLGFAGGDVPRDVLPNKDWSASFDRVIAALAEYDRQRQISVFFSNVAGGPRPLSYAAELVRKSINDHGRISSLYGYAGTQFDARRIADMVQRVLRILSIQSLQRAYGVTNPYQLIERVAAASLGQSVNVVKYKTMAESANGIMEIIARNAAAWSKTNSVLLFNDPVVSGSLRIGAAAPSPDVPDADRDALIKFAQYWLAVTGTGDQQVEKLAQPAPSLAAPSIPALYGGGNGQPSMDANAIDKIRQMVSSGSAPSLDQLQQLLPAMRS